MVVNLYPFARDGAASRTRRLDQALEKIDIGGVALLRAAAKNFPGVAAVSDPTQYASVLRDIKSQGTVSPETRQKLAAEAFALTAAYDAQIAELPEPAGGHLFPSRLTLVVEKKADLRYGENPHQLGAFYADPAQRRTSISRARQIAGKDLSFNNLLDLDAAWTIASDFKTPAVLHRQARQSLRPGQRRRPGRGVPPGPRGRQRLGVRRDHRRQPGGGRRGRAGDPARLLRGDRGARLHAGGARDPAHQEGLRDHRGARRPMPTAESWGSATSTSSGSAAGCWSRPSTTWRRTATSSRSSPSGGPPWRS